MDIIIFVFVLFNHIYSSISRRIIMNKDFKAKICLLRQKAIEHVFHIFYLIISNA